MPIVRRRWLLGAAAGAVAGVALGMLLAAPELSAWIRALSLGVGSTVLGVATLAAMMRGRRRPDVSGDDVWRALTVLGGVWLLLETVQLVLEAAATVDVPVVRLSSGLFVEYLGTAGSGRVAGAAWVCVAALTVTAALAFRLEASWSSAPVLVAAALALVARPVTGHMSQQPFGSLLDAAHVLAAGVWLGVLTALALLVRGRGAWSRLLPRYSKLATICVVVLGVTGVIDAAVRLESVAALVDTGYGRVLLAKVVVLVALLALAWIWRRTWVPAAEVHRAAADTSLRNAVIEVCAMSVAFGLAAALATTA
ncbi:MAG TPA: CopD family protein [Rhodococcus sp. (in: high G+C Gram-positive bacteria)]|uniref:CopD family protein n=1 Tax=Rhodococcus sp. SJ-3 TaxID=3454628 RepID=UPI002DAD404B|nr:CopD family protein [Rhodococcus sp. (in: high G+C Gram-positive bacteria)]